MIEVHPMAAKLLELEMCHTIIDFGKVFYRNPANIAHFENWRANRPP
jgi:hypothetical protein